MVPALWKKMWVFWKIERILTVLLWLSCSGMSNSARPHGLQHARLPCPLPPGVSSHSCPLNQWCFVFISSSAALFSFCLSSCPALGSFPKSRLFASSGQSTGASVSASVLLMNIQGWFYLGWTGWIFLQSKGLSRVFSSTVARNHRFFGAQPSSSSPSLTFACATGKTIALTIQTFVGKVMSLLFNTLSRFVTAVLSRSKHLLISYLQSLSTPR